MRKSNSLVAAIISLFVFLVLYIDVVFFGLLKGLDRVSLDFLRSGFFDWLAVFFDVLLESASFLVLTFALLGFLVYKKRNRDALFAGFVLILGAAFGYLIKLLVVRERPSGGLIEAAGFSFPSGHALIATLLFLVLIYLFKDEIKDRVVRNIFISVSVVLILLIGLSRLYLGVHWFSDVLAGFAFGIFWVYLGLVLRKS